MQFKNLEQFTFDQKFTSLLVGGDLRTISLTDDCEFYGSDYAMYEDGTTRAELNWTVFSDVTKTKPIEMLSLFFHDVQSYSLKKGKAESADEDNQLDFIEFKKEWEEVEFHFKLGKIIKVSAIEVEGVISPLNQE